MDIVNDYAGAQQLVADNMSKSLAYMPNPANNLQPETSSIMKSTLFTLFVSCTLALFLFSGCSGQGTVTRDHAAGDLNDTLRIPLTEMGNRTYKGFEGGLYPGGHNHPPDDHTAEGLERAQYIRPLDKNGNEDPHGKIVLMSAGMSNTARAFCGGNATAGCWEGTFLDQVARDPEVNHSTLVIVNGAQNAKDAGIWADPESDVYDVARDARMSLLDVTEEQVQVVWFKQANAGPTVSLPDPESDAHALESYTAEIMRGLKARYPNLKMVFLSSRTYGGHSTRLLNPEPYAYESGFAMKWLIRKQIDQMRNERIASERMGDLNYHTAVPWMAWGPYLWTDGLNPRQDGLIWEPEDVISDGVHPSERGIQKVGTLLLDFFKTSPFTRCWFTASGRPCS